MQKLFWFVVVLLAIYLIRRALERREREVPENDQTRTAAETIRECTYCGILVPLSEGVEHGGHFFCCAEHARRGKKA